MHRNCEAIGHLLAWLAQEWPQTSSRRGTTTRGAITDWMSHLQLHCTTSGPWILMAYLWNKPLSFTCISLTAEKLSSFSCLLDIWQPSSINSTSVSSLGWWYSSCLGLGPLWEYDEAYYASFSEKNTHVLTCADLHTQLQGAQKPPLPHFTDIETQAQDLRLICSKFHALWGFLICRMGTLPLNLTGLM